MPLGKWQTLQPFRMPEIQKEKNPPNQNKTNSPNLTIPILGKCLEQYKLAFAAGGNEKNGTLQQLHSSIFIQFIWNLKSTYTHTCRYTQLFIAALFVKVLY